MGESCFFSLQDYTFSEVLERFIRFSEFEKLEELRNQSKGVLVLVLDSIQI